MAFVLIIGPMKSGKSLDLIARVAPLEFAGKTILYIQPEANVRDSGITSRAGVNTKAAAVSTLKDVKSNFDVIGIDEINMFPTSDCKYIEEWVKKGKDVIISGLDLDYRAKTPPIVQCIMQLKPDEIIIKTAVCDACKSYDARFTQILKNGKPVLDGLDLVTPEDGTYEYQARCRNCFKKKS